MFRYFSTVCLALFLTPVLFAAPKPDKPIEIKVWVLNFDPITDPVKKTRFHEEYKWNDPRTLATAYAADVKEVSGGLITFKIVGWEDLDEFPVKGDGFSYTLKSYAECRKANKGWHDPDISDYPKIISKYKLAERVEKGEIDEVWWFGAPYFGFGESAMAGRDAFYINGPVYDAPKVKCKKAFAIMGFNYERGPAEMIHNLCHRTESTMSRIFGGWKTDRLDNDWAKFAANAHQSKGEAAVGTCHYPPNGKKDYDYSNKDFVESTADDWLNYPDLKGVKKKVNCETWGGPDYQRNYLKWWFSRLPKAEGVNPANERLNNWWAYIFRFNEFDAKGKPITPPDPKRERAAATAILNAGGKVELLASDGKVKVTEVSKIPIGEFFILNVDLVARTVTVDQLATLNKLPRLTHLNLGSAKIDDATFSGLTDLPALTWLSLSSTKVSDKSIAVAAKFPSLTYLELNNLTLTDTSVTHLAKHPNLRELHFTKTPLTDVSVVGFQAIPKLEKLSLAETKVTDKGLVHLAKVKGLSTLWLNKLDLTETSLAELKKAMPSVQINR